MAKTASSAGAISVPLHFAGKVTSVVAPAGIFRPFLGVPEATLWPSTSSA